MPLCSIILPCYNREEYLLAALNAIISQTFTNWELIIVDDGSTDKTAELIADQTSSIEQSVIYIYQENSGAYAARQRGLEVSQGKYIAFYDSDDIWIEYHLQQCIDNLEKNPDLDWIFGPCQRINFNNNEILVHNHLHEEKPSQQIMQLNIQRRDKLKLIDDHRLIPTILKSGWGIGLQHSVLRRKVFNSNSFWTDLQNGEDRFFLIRSLKRGAVIGYVEDIQTLYYVHSNNSSAVSKTTDHKKLFNVTLNVIRGYERLKDTENLSYEELKSIKQKLAHEYFWMLGYNSLIPMKQYKDAKKMLITGLKYNIYDVKMWKTFIVFLLKYHSFLIKH